MKMKQRQHRILCILSPSSFTAEPSSQFEVIKSALDAIPVNLLVHNAAEAFFVRVLTGGGHLPTGGDLIGSVGRRLISKDTRSYEQVLRDSDVLDQALASASKSFPPCHFHRYGFAHVGLEDLENVMRFAEDGAANPFRRYADHHWHPFDALAPPDLALLYIDRPGEMGPAATLALSWMNRFAQIPLKLLCPESLFQGQDRDKLGTWTDHWSLEVISDMQQLKNAIAENLSPDVASDSMGIDALPPLRKREGADLLAASMPDTVQTALDKGAGMIIWRDCGDDTGAVTAQLYAASRKGLWNHLILNGNSREALRQFAAANSNIVHSYCLEEKQVSTYSDPLYSFPSAAPAYGRTRSMPGQPLWMAVKDAGFISKLLVHHDPKTLMRMRVRDDALSLFEVGKQVRYHYQRPVDLPDGYLDEIVRMVEAGGSVNIQFVRHNLERAYLIAYAEEEGVIIGNSSLKQPREEYIDAVSQQSGIDLHAFLERGYTSVRPEYRGLGVGAKLLEGLTQRAGGHKIFSVIAESNVATQKMAMRNRTRRVATFFSQRAKKEMSVWIPEWMLPEGIELPPQPALDIGPAGQKDAS